MNSKQVVIAMVVVGVLAVVSHAQNVDLLLNNKRLVEREINCVLDRGHCDAIGRQIKGLLPEALNNNCRRCTPQQAQNARKLMNFMQKNYPNEWKEIVRRYGAKMVIRGWLI